jgi:hypothetical protein
MSAIEMNRLIQRAIAYRDCWESLSRLDPHLIGQYSLTEAEKQLLASPNPPGLAEAGVHPMLTMWLLLMRDPNMARAFDTSEYFADARASEQGG